MKVEGPGKSSNIKGPSKAGAKKGADGASFSGLLDETGGADAPKGVSGAMSINQLDALLALQEHGGTPQEAEKRAKKRALAVLDLLDQVKMDILAGGVPQSTLEQLTRLASAHRDAVMDPKLAAVLDEVDLRAQVELAKLSMK